jgi:hypothetical protein
VGAPQRCVVSEVGNRTTIYDTTRVNMPSLWLDVSAQNLYTQASTCCLLATPLRTLLVHGGQASHKPLPGPQL